MWHELRVVVHNRENTLVTQAAQGFAREEFQFAELVATNWSSLTGAVEDMPFQ
jgi:sorting nexin-8